MHLRQVATLVLLSAHSLVVAIPSASLTSQPAPWRRLSNFLIETIWGAPHPTTPKSKERFNAYNGLHKVAGNALARYGSDVVLRFNVSTARDVRGLADAADALFLDVWDYTEDWVDIRLAKDDVCITQVGGGGPALTCCSPGFFASRPPPRLVAGRVRDSPRWQDSFASHLRLLSVSLLAETLDAPRCQTLHLLTFLARNPGSVRGKHLLFGLSAAVCDRALDAIACQHVHDPRPPHQYWDDV